jgi:hypothetical protein
MGVISAPARKDIFVMWEQYGAIGNARIQPRGRIWLLTDTNSPDPDIEITCRIAWNHPSTGAVQYEDLGPISQARIRPNNSAEIWLQSGEILTFVAAPCVCGAGAVGQALPEDGRISMTYVNIYDRTKVTLG